MRLVLLLVATATVTAACSSSGDTSASPDARARSSATPQQQRQQAREQRQQAREQRQQARDSDAPAGTAVGGLQWRSCDLGPGIDCATLAVPLDWSNPTGPTIDLALGRRRAGGESPPLLVNPGGPGGSGLEMLTYGAVTAAVSDRYDIVSWDPRGVGRSAGLDCGDSVEKFLPLDPDPDNRAESTALEAAAQAVSEQCGLSNRELLAHMRTTDTARDLEAIRSALGAAKLDYLGFSYGTEIGQAYASLFPGHVGRMVLDGIVDPDESFTEFLLSQTRAFDRALTRQATQCEAAGRTQCGVENLLDAYDRVRTQVERRPIRGTDGPTGPAELAMAGITTAYQPAGWRALGPALREALKGDGSALRRISDSYQDMAGYAPYAAVLCSDGPTPRGVDAYRNFAAEAMKVSPRFGGAIANELLPCATWPVSNNEAANLDVAEVPAILLIGNTNDPATPFDNARRVHRRIAGSVLVEVDSDGHTAYGSNTCVNQIVESYLLESELPPEGSRSC